MLLASSVQLPHLHQPSKVKALHLYKTGGYLLFRAIEIKSLDDDIAEEIILIAVTNTFQAGITA